MAKDKGVWFTSPPGISRNELIAGYDQAMRAMCAKACPPSHVISYSEIRPGTLHWKCDVCGPVATVTLFKH